MSEQESKVQQFPLMIYKDGQPGDDYRIVEDAEAAKAAEADGYFRAGKGPRVTKGRGD